MNAKDFVARLEQLSNEEDMRGRKLTGYNSSTWVGGCGSLQNPSNIGSSSVGSSSYPFTTTGGTPYPYFGDPLPPNVITNPNYPSGVTLPPNVITSTNWPNAIGSLYQGPSAFEEFLNICFLQAEGICAVTGRKINKGEPVLILFEHVICKEAFQKLLVRQFESMMVPAIEEMHEVSNYDE